MRMVSDAMGQIGGQDGLSVRGFACFTPFGDSFCCGGQLVFFVGVGLLFVLVAFAVLLSVGGGVFCFAVVVTNWPPRFRDGSPIFSAYGESFRFIAVCTFIAFYHR